ncbi:MAG: hypothetical protein QOD83_4222 [Solirubrobacteraceae bacterium]|jgi:hypothetical protein|nr:hypothetical protein [Solirubrobacteraceae bacterium]
MLATRARENLLRTCAARDAAHEDIRTERLDTQERGRRRRRWWSGILAGDPAPFALEGVGKAVTRADPVACGAAVVTTRASQRQRRMGEDERAASTWVRSPPLVR